MEGTCGRFLWMYDNQVFQDLQIENLEEVIEEYRDDSKYFDIDDNDMMVSPSVE